MSLTENKTGRCYYCSALFGRRNTATARTIDHKTPQCRGGTDDLENLVYACRKCNNEKGNMTLSEYLSYIAAGRPRSALRGGHVRRNREGE